MMWYWVTEQSFHLLLISVLLSFLNSPANRISLPDITISVVHYGISSWIFNNEDLAQTDNQIRTVSIRPFTPLSAVNLRIRFQFTVFHDFDWVFLSEIRNQLCNQKFITFQMTSSNIIQPSADDLRRGSTELVCTVSSEGSYVWQWKRDNAIIENKGDYRITMCEGNNTIILQNGTVVPSIIFNITIHNLLSADGGNYTCRGVRGESVTQLTIVEGTDPNILSQTSMKGECLNSD